MKVKSVFELAKEKEKINKAILECEAQLILNESEKRKIIY